MYREIELLICHEPRFKDQVACLSIEWKPGDIDGTQRGRQLVTRLPNTLSVILNSHVVGLRRNFVFVCHFRTSLNNHTASNYN